VLFASLTSASSVHGQDPWSLHASLITEIAPVALNGHIQLEHPIGATRLSDGTIVVGDARRATIAFFDRSGREVQATGRSGGGPGEFRDLWWIGQCSFDTVFAWDRANARITVIGASGRVIREVPPPIPPAQAGRTAFATCSASGHTGVVSLPTTMDPRQPIQRSAAAVTVIDAMGESVQVGDEIASSEFVVRGGGGMPRPLGHVTTIALGTSRVFVGTGDSAAVLSFSLQGGRMGSIRVPRAEKRVVTSEQYERAIDDLLVLAPSQAVEAIRPMLLELPRPQHTPHYNSVHVDPSGVLWVVQTVAAERTRLIGVDSIGSTVGIVLLPESLHVYEIGDDYVLGLRYNSVGEPFIVAYGFRRPVSPSGRPAPEK